MEVKTLLRIIKDDVSHLEAITGEFNNYSLPLPDEIDVALVRANALLKELELLHKFAVQHESSYKAVQPEVEPKIEVPDPEHSEEEPFELFAQEKYPETKIVAGKPQHSEGLTEATPVSIPDDETRTTETHKPEDAMGDTFATEDMAVVEKKVSVADETAVVEVVIVPNVTTDHLEEVVAEEFQEEKKTLNEALSEPHQMVNDLLTPEKGEAGYHIIPINSIWDGIGINDRFLFIRELFANSSVKFESAIEAIDQMGSIQDAVSYLKMNFKWNKTEASQKFLVLVKRRFTK
jgi:hypothetical protein